MAGARPRTGSYVDEVLLEALAEVVHEGGLAGVRVEQHEVLHPDLVAGRQGPFHVQTDVLPPHFFSLQGTEHSLCHVSCVERHACVARESAEPRSKCSWKVPVAPFHSHVRRTFPCLDSRTPLWYRGLQPEGVAPEEEAPLYSPGVYRLRHLGLGMHVTELAKNDAFLSISLSLSGT